MSDELRDVLEQLEREGWASLCDGTGADFYGRVMTDDGMMVLAHGMAMRRDEVVSALRESPPWRDYRIEDLRLVTTGRDSAALVYRGLAYREGEDPAFVGWMTSVYTQVAGSWRLALYTQTPVPGATGAQ